MFTSHISNLLEFQDVMVNHNIVVTIVRWLLWPVIKFFEGLSQILTDILEGAYSILDILVSEELVNFFAQYRSIFTAVLLISIGAYAVTVFTNPGEKTKRFVLNIFTCIMVVSGLPIFLEQAINLASVFINEQVTENRNIGQEIVLSNMVDLYKVDEVDFNREQFDRLKAKHSISEDNWSIIDINELIEPKDMKNKKAFSTKVTIDKDGELAEQDLDVGFLKFWMFSDYYYRYHLDMVPVIMSLASYDFGLAIMSVKVIIFIYSLVVAEGLMVIFSRDLAGGARLKQAFDSFWQTLAVLAATTILTALYGIFIAFIMSKFKGMAAAIYILGATFVYIDGPNDIEKVLGVDAGLKSGLRTAAGVMMAGRLTKGVADAVKGIAKTGGKVLAGAGMAGAYHAGKWSAFDEAMKKPKEGVEGLTPEDRGNPNGLPSGQTSLDSTEKPKLDYNSRIGSEGAESAHKGPEQDFHQKDAVASKNSDPKQAQERGKQSEESNRRPKDFGDMTLSEYMKEKKNSSGKQGFISKAQQAYSMGKNTGRANFERYDSAYGKHRPVAEQKARKIQSTVADMFKKKNTDYDAIQRYGNNSNDRR